MAEWLIEHGIGETRALLVENGDAIAAQIQWPDELIPGLIEDAQLIHRPKASKRGVARFANGEEAMVDRLPADASEGAAIRLEVLRSAIIERGRTKPAQARPTQADCRPAPTLAEKLRGREVHHFPDGLWEDLWGQAADGTASFDGGALHFAPSAAMTLIDIDGHLQPRELALAAIAPLAAAIRQMGLGGNIAVDFPTLQAKADRKEVDERLAMRWLVGNMSAQR